MHAQPKKPFHWPDSLMNSANLPATTAKEEGRPFFLIMPPATRARRSASVTWARQHAWWGNNWQISRPQSRRKSLTCSNPFPPLLHNCQSFTGFASFSATFTSAPPPSTTSPRTQIRKKSKIKVGARAGDFFPSLSLSPPSLSPATSNGSRVFCGKSCNQSRPPGMPHLALAKVNDSTSSSPQLPFDNSAWKIKPEQGLATEESERSREITKIPLSRDKAGFSFVFPFLY